MLLGSTLIFIILSCNWVFCAKWSFISFNKLWINYTCNVHSLFTFSKSPSKATFTQEFVCEICCVQRRLNAMYAIAAYKLADYLQEQTAVSPLKTLLIIEKINTNIKNRLKRHPNGSRVTGWHTERQHSGDQLHSWTVSGRDWAGQVTSAYGSYMQIFTWSKSAADPLDAVTWGGREYTLWDYHSNVAVIAYLPYTTARMSYAGRLWLQWLRSIFVWTSCTLCHAL